MDIQAGVAQRAGVGRYVQKLVERLGACASPADEMRLFFFDFQRKGLPMVAPGARQRACRWLPGRYVQAAWKLLNFPPFDWLAGAADVYHFPNFIVPPLTRGKSVVTIHDVSFLRFPDAAEPRNLAYLTAKIRDTVARADAIITDSAFSGREIHELLGVPEERIHPILLGLPSDFRRPTDTAIAAARKQLGLERPYILSVGTLEPRKNFPFLVESFERLAGFDGNLVIAGMKGWKYEPILARMQSSPRAARIKHVDYVPEELLAPLYAGAELFVFPSLYEGFGFTPLEAMACGTPALISANGSLPEVCGGGAETVPVLDAGLWAQRIGALLAESTTRAALTIKGTQHISKFSWQTAAQQTWEVYRTLSGASA
ncbi:MAG: glycosyltransferase family 1 protein [Kiritimatiellaeota bacterium]|nr:glycosyltransferase family 1 protein [Kiritimatiellota bacterium]